MKLLGYFGGLLIIGVILFAYNIAQTLLHVPKWNIIAMGVASALAWLLLTITAGLFLVAGQRGWAPMLRINPIAAMDAHAHLGAVGFFTMLIVGVSYKPLSILATALCWPDFPTNPFTARLDVGYAFLGLIGFVSFGILGMLYKIIPFLIWFGIYSKHIGCLQVPALAQMYSERLQAVGYWSYLPSLLATVWAMLFASVTRVRLGCGLLALSLVVFDLNVGKMLSHDFRLKLVPLTLNKTTNRTVI